MSVLKNAFALIAFSNYDTNMNESTLPATAIDAIRACLHDITPVRFAYLFGSLARGTAGPLSDIDIAVYLDPSVNAFDQRLRLIDLLSTAARTERIDVVVLNSASPLLKFTAIKEGILLKEDRALRVPFEAGVISEYLDTKHLRDVQSAYIRRDFSEGIRID